MPAVTEEVLIENGRKVSGTIRRHPHRDRAGGKDS